MKTLVGIAPWAVVLLGIGAAVWFLSDRNLAAGRWLLAGVLVAHGLVHLLYLVPQPATATAGGDWPFDLARPWVVTSANLDPAVARAIATGLIAAVIVGFGLSGLSTAGILLPSSWWPTLVSVSSGLSLLMLLLFFAPGLMVGMALDGVLLWVALASTWRPLPV